ncbi:MAG: type IX secretion system membrane protein PorP/SprF [Prevotellaceae bacterium]|nr:type IX secretion system membrane protein PorP/SprF [Prevotellaceae bacterium]MDY2750534.1 type IX secretion system membrane protein PorP/SprF [Prevotella sp.]
MRKRRNVILEPVVQCIKGIVLASALMLATMGARAQYDPYFSHYFDMQPSFNPAAAGKEAKLNITGTYAMSMAGFENSPQTMVFSGDMPFIALKNVHGVGLQLMSDKLGLFSHQRISLQYALRKKLGNGWLSVGVQPGIITEKFNGSSVDLIDETDPVFSKSDIDGNTFDLAAGIYYAGKNWYAGISAQHLTSPTVLLGETNELKIDGTYYLTGGMDFQLRNPLMKVATSAVVRTDGVAYRGDITGRLIYNYQGRMFYAGATYSPTNSVTTLVGGQFQGVIIAYSFEIYTNGISFRNGSHEIFLGYQMDVNLSKKGKNRHQTTRTL